jgi:hypothetical protein
MNTDDSTAQLPLSQTQRNINCAKEPLAKETKRAKTVSALQAQPYDNWLVGLLFIAYQRSLGKVPVIGRVVKYVHQALGAAIAVWAGMLTLALVNIGGPSEYLQTLASGLGFQLQSLLFYNGTVAVIMALLLTYGVLSLLSLNKALYVMDAVIVYYLIIQSFHFYQLPVIISPVSLLFLIWGIHRLLLGGVAVLYRKAGKARPATTMTTTATMMTAIPVPDTITAPIATITPAAKEEDQ